MGSFSWCYCDAGKIRIDKYGCKRPRRDQRLVGFSKDHPATVLVPEKFGGKSAQIDVEIYEDYGRFGGEDIYNLVADWNREWISENPDYVCPHDAAYAVKHPEYPAKKMSDMPWWPYYSVLSLSREEIVERWKESSGRKYVEYRDIGIAIACYDADNAALPYPIKIARHKESVYENCPPSHGDPYQGFD